MNIFKTIPAILLIPIMVTACFKSEYDTEAVENPDSDVKITYLGKGFSEGVAFYGDQFLFEADSSFRFDYVVLTDAAYNNRYGTPSNLASIYTEALHNYLELNKLSLEDYLLCGTCTHSSQILPEGDYTVYVLEINSNGKSTGKVYSKKFTVKEYLDYKVDGNLQLVPEWKAEYLGRYQSENNSGLPIWCDRISSTGTGDALYYHVIAEAGSLDSQSALLSAFEKGAGVDDMKGGKGIIEWYKLLAPEANFSHGLDWLLAKGDKSSDNGFLDYTISSDTGTYDVYTVEMLLSGHISGRYGKTTLEISGSPNLADPKEVAKSGRRSRIPAIGKMRL